MTSSRPLTISITTASAAASSASSTSPRGAVSPRLRPVSESIAARAAAVSVALAKPRDPALFQPRPSQLPQPSANTNGIDLSALPAYLGEGEMPVNAPVRVSETSSGGVVNTLAPAAPALSAGGKAAPLDWREREAALRQIQKESSDGSSSSSPEQIAARLARMMTMSGRPVFSYLGGAPMTSISSPNLKHSEGPIKAAMIDAPNLSPIGAAGGAVEFAPIQLSVITGQLSKLRKVPKPNVDLKKPDSQLPPWARAKPSEVARGAAGIRFQMGKVQLGKTGKGNVKALPQMGSVDSNVYSAHVSTAGMAVPSVLIGSTSSTSSGFVSLAPQWTNLFSQNDTDNPKNPSCYTCGGEITDDQSIEVDGRDFHCECFICCRCKIPLGEGDLLTVKERFYHSTCMRCTHCDVDCTDQDIAVGDGGEIYCRRHAMLAKGLDLPSVPCAGCRSPIYDDPEVQVAAMGENYFHLQCMICAHCKCSLLTEKAFSHGAYFYCERDYVNLFALQCTTCNEFVEGPCVQITNKMEDPVTHEMVEYKYSFHPDHFRCNRCNGDLRSMGFIIHENELLCAEDFEALA